MKLEFVAEGSSECPLIRLFNFGAAEVRHLRSACAALACGFTHDFAVHAEPWVEPINGCQLIFRLTQRDIGVGVRALGTPFLLQLSDDGWIEVDDKIAVFATDAAGFNWLWSAGDIKVLISRDGHW